MAKVIYLLFFSFCQAYNNYSKKQCSRVYILMAAGYRLVCTNFQNKPTTGPNKLELSEISLKNKLAFVYLAG